MKQNKSETFNKGERVPKKRKKGHREKNVKKINNQLERKNKMAKDLSIGTRFLPKE